MPCADSSDCARREQDYLGTARNQFGNFGIVVDIGETKTRFTVGHNIQEAPPCGGTSPGFKSPEIGESPLSRYAPIDFLRWWLVLLRRWQSLAATVLSISQQGDPAKAHSLLSLDVMFESLRITVFHGVQLLAVKFQFSRHFEDLVGNPDHAHLWISRPFFKLGSNRIDGVAHKYRFDESQLVVSIAEGMNVVVCHQPKT